MKKIFNFTLLFSLFSLFFSSIGCEFSKNESEFVNEVPKVLQDNSGFVHGGEQGYLSLNSKAMIGTANSISDVKNKLLDKILQPTSYLAHFLGYGWCGGTRAQYIGEDFYRTTNGWQARYDKNDPHSGGYKSDHRLGIEMHNWDFEIVSIELGSAVINELQPLNVYTGTFDNTQSNQADSFSRTISYRRNNSVTDTRDSSFNWGTSISLEKDINIPFVGGVKTTFTQSFGGNYSTGHSETEDKGHDDSYSVNLDVPAFQKLTYQLFLAQTKSTIPYTARIRIKGNLELKGFLKWGQGKRPTTNYHYQHMGSGSRPTVHYTFGNGESTFYEEIKEQRQYNILPWRWNEMLDDHFDSVNWAIERLSNQNEYIFTVKGKFTQVSGTHIDVRTSGVIADVELYGATHYYGAKKVLQFYDESMQISAMKPNILYSLVDMGWNDRMKSYKANIAPGWQVTFYEHTNGTGQKYTLSGEESNSDFSNFLASSIRLEGEGNNSGGSDGSGSGVIQNGLYKIISKHSNKVLEDYQFNTQPGANVVQWKYTGADNQHWYVTKVNNDSYKIVNKHSNLVFDVSNSSTENGANIHLWTYHGGNNQLWQIEQVDGTYFKIINKNSGQSVDLFNWETASGANIVQWSYNGGNNQLWKFVWIKE